MILEHKKDERLQLPRELEVLGSSLTLLVTIFSTNASSLIQGLLSPHSEWGWGSVTPSTCNIFSLSSIWGMEDDSRQMGLLTSVSPCGTPVTAELFCHLCCHQIRLIQEVERRAFLVTLNHRGKWLCDTCAFCEKDWLRHFLGVERGAWCIRIWISDMLVMVTIFWITSWVGFHFV